MRNDASRCSVACSIKQLLAQVFAITGGRGPTGRLHLYFVGGYDDGGRSSRATSARWRNRRADPPLLFLRSPPNGERAPTSSQALPRGVGGTKKQNPIRFFVQSGSGAPAIATSAAAANRHSTYRANASAPACGGCWAISFFSPKNVIRNSQAGLLTWIHRPMQPSQPSGQWSEAWSSSSQQRSCRRLSLRSLFTRAMRADTCKLPCILFFACIITRILGLVNTFWIFLRRSRAEI